jgi:hypothetical protein
MYTLFKNVSAKKILAGEMPALGLSLITAEAFYKFGSFILECASFLLTWYVVSMVLHTIFAPKAIKKNKYRQLRPVKTE